MDKELTTAQFQTLEAVLNQIDPEFARAWQLQVFKEFPSLDRAIVPLLPRGEK